MTISITSHTTAPKPPKAPPRAPKASFAEVLGGGPDKAAASADANTVNGPFSQAPASSAEPQVRARAQTPEAQPAPPTEAPRLHLDLAAARQIREEALHAFGFNQLGLLGLGAGEATAKASTPAPDTPARFDPPAGVAETVLQDGTESYRPGGAPVRPATPTTTASGPIPETVVAARTSQIGSLASVTPSLEANTEPLAFTEEAAPGSPTKRPPPARRAAAPQAPGVAVMEENGAVHLAALSPGLGPVDREQLRRQAASVIESHGLNAGSVTLNGETFGRPYLSMKGGAHGG